ncbi:hypothetical protein AMK29_22885 [Streptomyces sp. CB02261]|nr:hypothetical protein AMK29_22885 [Streptomyces sp. CB02261]
MITSLTGTDGRTLACSPASTQGSMEFSSCPGCSSDSREYTTRWVTPRARVASASSVAPSRGKYGGESNCRICSRALAQACRIRRPIASPVTTSTRRSSYAARRWRRNDSNAPPTVIRDSSISAARCRPRISRPAAGGTGATTSVLPPAALARPESISSPYAAENAAPSRPAADLIAASGAGPRSSSSW